MLSNSFAFRLCNLLAFRGLDLAYMPSPLGFANCDRPHARVTPPRASAAKFCREALPQRIRTGRGSGRARFMTGEDQTTRREDLDGATTAEREMPQYEGV